MKKISKFEMAHLFPFNQYMGMGVYIDTYRLFIVGKTIKTLFSNKSRGPT